MNKLVRNYHDWYLLGVNTDIKKHTLEITLGYAEERSVIIFQNVKHCLVDKFTIGNIVLDIYVYDRKIPIERIIDNGALNELLGVPKESTYFKKIIEGIEKGTLLYAEINPSYGCTATIEKK